MRAPLSWIREFTPLDAPVDDIEAALNRVGLEVEGVEQPGLEIVGVRAARVVDVVKHPNADRLTLVDLDTGDGAARVVCGATNVHAGMLAPYAPAGATLPGGITLERRPIKGEVSDGMLLSPRELGLGDDHSGIMDLDASIVPGTGISNGSRKAAASSRAARTSWWARPRATPRTWPWARVASERPVLAFTMLSVLARSSPSTSARAISSGGE